VTNACCSCLADKGNGEKYHCQSERTPVGRDFNVPLTLEEYDACDEERGGRSHQKRDGEIVNRLSRLFYMGNWSRRRTCKKGMWGGRDDKTSNGCDEDRRCSVTMCSAPSSGTVPVLRQETDKHPDKHGFCPQAIASCGKRPGH